MLFVMEFESFTQQRIKWFPEPKHNNNIVFTMNKGNSCTFSSTVLEIPTPLETSKTVPTAKLECCN